MVKRKYDDPTEMLAVRIPAPLHDALKAKAERENRPKSEVVVELLTAALKPPFEGVFE